MREQGHRAHTLPTTAAPSAPTSPSTAITLNLCRSRVRPASSLTRADLRRDRLPGVAIALPEPARDERGTGSRSGSSRVCACSRH